MTGDSLSDEPVGGAQTRMVQVSSSSNLMKGFSKVRPLTFVRVNPSHPSPGSVPTAVTLVTFFCSHMKTSRLHPDLAALWT